MDGLAGALATSVGVWGQGPTEGQSKRIQVVEYKARVIREKVFLRDQLNLLVAVKRVPNSKHRVAQIGIIGQKTSLDPCAGSTVHSGSVVNVALATLFVH